MSDSARRDANSAGSAPIASIGVVLAIAGFALLAVEVIRTLTGGVLGTTGTILLWVGVGVLAVGLILLVLSLAGGDDESTATDGHTDDIESDTVAPWETPATAEVPPPPAAAEPTPPPPVATAPPAAAAPPAPAPPPPPAPAPTTPPPAAAPVEAMPPVSAPDPATQPLPVEDATQPPSAD